jgi:hypothetical protein
VAAFRFPVILISAVFACGRQPAFGASPAPAYPAATSTAHADTLALLPPPPAAAPSVLFGAKQNFAVGTVVEFRRQSSFTAATAYRFNGSLSGAVTIKVMDNSTQTVIEAEVLLYANWTKDRSADPAAARAAESGQFESSEFSKFYAAKRFLLKKSGAEIEVFDARSRRALTDFKQKNFVRRTTAQVVPFADYTYTYDLAAELAGHSMVIGDNVEALVSAMPTNFFASKGMVKVAGFNDGVVTFELRGEATEQGASDDEVLRLSRREAYEGRAAINVPVATCQWTSITMHFEGVPPKGNSAYVDWASDIVWTRTFK